MEIHIDVDHMFKDIEYLPFRGENDNATLGLTNHYFEKDGRPWYPVMGEFHFSRFPEIQWQRELYKMKSGGIDIVASYIIWIHHEEINGAFDFSGQRNLRQFVEACNNANMYFYLRIGPWAHGEVRNGGFPDWVQHSGWDLRSDDPQYLKHVKRYFEKVYEQVEGLFFKDGGPIIGVQIENEYGHVGGYRGEKGKNHMLTLKKMLQDIGFNVPFYTSTGWGGGVVVDNETIPVFGGYVDAPWHPHTEELPANENFVFAPYFDDSLIASDHKPTNTEYEDFDFSVEKYPYLTAELGGGLQVTKHRRPLVCAKDIETQAMVKLASGANLLGYYMYHGGMNPKGKVTTLQESKESGSHTDVPVISYDFQAPLRGYGTFHESYGALRKLHQFIHSFEDVLVTSETLFSDPLITNPVDLESLRYCIRFDQKTQSGFLFINNYQRRRKMKTHKNVTFTLRMDQQVITFPSMDIKDGHVGMYPFNLKINDSHLESSSATLFCLLNDVWVFYHSEPENACIRFIGETPKYIVISDEEANKAIKYHHKLLISEANLWTEDNDLYVSTSHEHIEVVEYPTKKTHVIEPASAFGNVYVKSTSREAEKHKTYKLSLNYNASEDSDDFFLEINFTGDRGLLFDLDGERIADWFSTGETWRVSMKTLGYPEHVVLEIHPIEQDTYFERDLGHGCTLQSTALKPCYVKKLSLE